MALNVKDCRAMIAAAAEAGVVLAVGQNTRRTPHYRKAAELIRAGAIGDVVLAEANQTRAQSYRIGGLWRHSRIESPGGPLASFTIHQAAAIQEGRKPEVAGEEGMAAIAVMEAIVRSAESGAPVEVGSL